MARALKVYRAHIGFFDTVVAAPSQKDALAAWGGAPAEFRQSFASVTDDPAAVTAALKQPGTVLYRLFGTSGAFSTERTLPKSLPASLAKADARDAKKAVPKKAARAQTPQQKAKLAKAARAQTAQQKAGLAKVARAKARQERAEKGKARADEQRRAREEKECRARERREAQKDAREELDRALEAIDRDERDLKQRRADARAAYDAALARLRERD